MDLAERVRQLKHRGLPAVAVAAILDMETADVVALLDDPEAPVALTGGNAITDVLVLGSEDLPLEAGWRAADPVDDGEAAPQIYKQGGRIYMSGYVVPLEAATTRVCELPLSYAPVAPDPTSVDLGFAVTSNWLKPAIAEIVSHNQGGVGLLSYSLFLMDGTNPGGTTPPAVGEYVSLDGISWPAA